MNLTAQQTTAGAALVAPVQASAGAVGHFPHVPAWDCRTCSQPWPCPDRRGMLAAEPDRLHVTLFLAGCLDAAAGDLAGTTENLYERFLGWNHAPGPAAMRPAA
jgi:hypothetical protein